MRNDSEKRASIAAEARPLYFLLFLVNDFAAFICAFFRAGFYPTLAFARILPFTSVATTGTGAVPFTGINTRTVHLITTGFVGCPSGERTTCY